MKSKNLFLLYSVVALAFIGGTGLKSQVTLNGNVRYQMIDGFGFSSAWCGTLSSAKNNALYNTLGMSLLRIRIDPNQNWSSETANAAAAHAAGAKVLGTPWSPPASMKTNGNVVHGSLSTDQYYNYAQYLNNAANSIGLDYVSLQNEPDWDPDYEGCQWTGDQFKNFLKYYGQYITKPVVMPEAVNFNNDYSDPTLNDATAASHMSIAAGHFYGNGNYVHQNALDKGKHVWMTEHYLDGRDDISVCMNVAKEINQALNNWFSAYFWWWVYESSTAMNPVSNSGTIYKNGYVMGQFAKFIRPGKQRIQATYNPTSGVYVTAYRNNGEVIVVVNTNTYSSNQTFTLQNLGATAYTVYRTSGSENMSNKGTVSVSNNQFSYNFPSQSVTTFVQSGSGEGCTPTSIVPYLQVDGASWQQTSSVTINSGSSVKFGPQPTSGGSWNWSGCGTSGSSREQTVSPTSSCSATATYTNSSGCQSTQTFNVTVNSSSGGGSYNNLTNRSSGKCLGVEGGSFSNNAIIDPEDCNSGYARQQWEIQDVGDGYSIIKNALSGKCMRVVNNDVVQYDCYDYYWTEMFSIENASDAGYYIFRNRSANQCLREYNGDIYLVDCNTTWWTQMFQITSLKSADSKENIIEKSNKNIDIYPTIVYNSVYIKLDNELAGASMSLYNSIGVLMFSKELNNDLNSIDVSSLSPGMYFIQVNSGITHEIRKIIKK